MTSLYRPARRSRQTVNRKEKVRRRFLGRMLAVGVPLLLVSAAAAAGFAGGAFGSQWLGPRVKDAPVFGLATLTVKGSRILSEAEVAETAGMTMGESVLALDLAAVRTRLLDHPLIRRASVARQLPAQVVIEIEERTPAAVVRGAGGRGEHIVDHDGRVVAFPPGAVPAGLPCFSGVEVNGGAVTAGGRQDLDDGIAIFREIRSFGFPPLDEVECIDLSRRSDAVLLPAGDGPLVHIGRAETEARLRRWSQVAVDLAEHWGEIDYIDLRARGQVVARPRELPGNSPEGEGGEG